MIGINSSLPRAIPGAIKHILGWLMLKYVGSLMLSWGDVGDINIVNQPIVIRNAYQPTSLSLEEVTLVFMVCQLDRPDLHCDAIAVDCGHH